MKLSWFSPLPPARTGIADYAAQLLPMLTERCDLTVWTDQPEWDRGLERVAPVHHYDPARLPWEALNQADAAIYHIGNDFRFHGGILEASRQAPGIVVLHDFSLHSFVEHVFMLGRQDRDGYLQYVEQQYGPDGRRDVEALWRGEQGINYMSERYPLTEFALERALGVLVHTRGNFEALAGQRRLPAAFAPLPYVSAASPAAAARADAPPYRLIIFGHIGPNRRLEAVVQALAGLPQRDLFRLDVYGRFGEAQDEARMRALITSLGLEHLATLHGFAEDAVLHRALAGAHLAINLRYPSLGEASLSQLLIWDHALPTLVTPVGLYADLPREAVHFVRPSDEVADIQAHLQALLAEPARFATMGLHGRRVLAEQHTPDAYIGTLLDFASHSRGFRLLTAGDRLAARVGAEMGAWSSPTAPREAFLRPVEAVYHMVSATLMRPSMVGKTAIEAPLPVESCRAALRWLEPPEPLTAGLFTRIRVLVTNTSPCPWPALGNESGCYQIKLGNHWLDADGNTVVPEDGRAGLPRDVGPSDAVELSLTVRPPDVPGRYLLELDLVQEGVAWFAHQGSTSERVMVEVRERRAMAS